MNKNYLLIIFILLLLGLFVCSLWGAPREGFDKGETKQTNSNSLSEIHYAPNGATAQVTDDEELIITNTDGSTNTYIIDTTKKENTNGTTETTYNGANGGKATLTTSASGISVFYVVGPKGETVAFTPDSNKTQQTNNYDHYDHFNQGNNPVTFYGPEGTIARIVRTGDKNTLVVTNADGSTTIYYLDKPAESQPTVAVYIGPNGGSAKVLTNKFGTKSIEITKADGTVVVYYDNKMYTNDADTPPPVASSTDEQGAEYNTAFSTNANKEAYSSSLPPGIPASQIPSGDEDLYILKSQVVPPVCPACPTMQCPEIDKSKCPPCEPCGRCPEPNFECKKVPNYKAFNPDSFPVPVLAPFSSFGQ